jgi:hypothetical protein
MKRVAYLLPLFLAAPVQADEQVWLAGIAQGPISGKLITWIEVLPRFTDGGDRLGQTILRPALGVQLNPAATLLLGYAFIENNPDGLPSRREHRIWQQAQVRLAGTPGKAVLVSRTRLEQRFLEGADEDGWRLRQFLRGQYWLSERWSLIGVSEAFVGLGATSWGQRSGLEQVRTFAAVGHAITPRITLEAGYLNQRLVQPVEPSSEKVMNSARPTTFSIGNMPRPSRLTSKRLSWLLSRLSPIRKTWPSGTMTGGVLSCGISPRSRVR